MPSVAIYHNEIQANQYFDTQVRQKTSPTFRNRSNFMMLIQLLTYETKTPTASQDIRRA